jgi:hypothetical protein
LLPSFATATLAFDSQNLDARNPTFARHDGLRFGDSLHIETPQCESDFRWREPRVNRLHGTEVIIGLAVHWFKELNPQTAAVGYWHTWLVFASFEGVAVHPAYELSLVMV